MRTSKHIKTYFIAIEIELNKPDFEFNSRNTY